MLSKNMELLRNETKMESRQYSLYCRRIMQTTIKFGRDIDIVQRSRCAQVCEQGTLNPRSIRNRKIRNLPAFQDRFIPSVTRQGGDIQRLWSQNCGIWGSVWMLNLLGVNRMISCWYRCRKKRTNRSEEADGAGQHYE